jgi:hypothetical protein
MITKLILNTHVILALIKQAKRFDIMLVYLAKSVDLAIS